MNNHSYIIINSIKDYPNLEIGDKLKPIGYMNTMSMSHEFTKVYGEITFGKFHILDKDIKNKNIVNEKEYLIMKLNILINDNK